MRWPVLLACVLALGVKGQISIGFTFHGASPRSSGLPDTLTTWLESECDVKPEYPGGPEAWARYVIEAPGCDQAPLTERCLKRTEVVVRFLIERDGSISDARIAKGECTAWEDLALCAMHASPPWKPGRRGGWKVRTRMEVRLDYGSR